MDKMNGMSNRIRGVISLLLGIFCSVGLQLSLVAEVTEANTEDIDFNNEIIVGIRTLYLSMKTSRITLVLLAVCLAVMIYKGGQIILEKWQRNVLIAFSAVFSILQLFAISFKENDSLYYVFGSFINVLRSLIHGIALGIVCFVVLKIIAFLIRRFCTQKALQPTAITWKNSLFIFGLFFIAWLPYFIIFYPGTANTDTVVQMMQSFQIPSYINELTTMQPPQTYYTNHHPFATTMLFELFFKLGLNIFGDINIGVAIYVVLHMLFISAVFTTALQYLRYIGVTPKRILFIQLVIMFLPIFPMYAICMVKDTLFAAFLLLFMIMMYEVARTDGEIFKKWQFNLMMALDSAFIMLTKNYGWYILIIVAVVYAIAYRKYIIRIAVTFVPIILIYQLVWTSLLLPMWNVAPVGKQEMLSVPFQQTARYVTEYPDEVTEEEKEAINGVLPYNRLPKLYEPMLSDWVKEKFNQESTGEDISKYFSAWWKMFLKHPGTYIESILNNTYEYWDIDKISDLEYYEFEPYLQKHDTEDQYTDLYVTHSDKTEVLRYAVYQFILMLEKTPIVNIFASLGLMPWLILYMIVFSFFQKRGKYVLTYLVPVIIYAICMVGPDNGNSRYIMPVIFAMPYLIALLFRPVSEEDKKH
ncbi:MAG: DUF6020 family protein [Lachnospiraceae bacterium]|nr:DUF6020 family protein [Lachnospiraceae bacterium]